jgi:hypothetical protein
LSELAIVASSQRYIVANARSRGETLSNIVVIFHNTLGVVEK